MAKTTAFYIRWCNHSGGDLWKQGTVLWTWCWKQELEGRVTQLIKTQKKMINSPNQDLIVSLQKKRKNIRINIITCPKYTSNWPRPFCLYNADTCVSDFVLLKTFSKTVILSSTCKIQSVFSRGQLFFFFLLGSESTALIQIYISVCLLH